MAAAVGGVLLLISGCSVTTQVAVNARPDGTGDVTVTVTLDKAAVASVGDVATELQTGDLAAAGWTVHGPSPGAGGTTVVTASKPFATLAGASSIVEEIAGSGPAASQPFQVAISRHRSFFKTTTVLQGSVNLRCGLNCFGDPGLQKIIGSATGINPATAQRDTGIDPTTIFHFQMAINLPGKLKATDAPARGGSSATTQLRWTPALGADVALSALTQTTNTTHVKEVKIAVGAGVLLVVALVLWWVLARWRRRRRHRRAHAIGSSVTT